MFNWMGMLDNYEQRMVGRHEGDKLLVSTARVTDADLDYETYVEIDGEGKVVEPYATIEQAKVGHDKWVARMTGDNPPTINQLTDKGLSGINKLLDAVRGTDWRSE